MRFYVTNEVLKLAEKDFEEAMKNHYEDFNFFMVKLNKKYSKVFRSDLEEFPKNIANELWSQMIAFYNTKPELFDKKVKLYCMHDKQTGNLIVAKSAAELYFLLKTGKDKHPSLLSTEMRVLQDKLAKKNLEKFEQGKKGIHYWENLYDQMQEAINEAIRRRVEELKMPNDHAINVSFGDDKPFDELPDKTCFKYNDELFFKMRTTGYSLQTPGLTFNKYVMTHTDDKCNIDTRNIIVKPFSIE